MSDSQLNVNKKEVEKPNILFIANSFRINLYENWQDKTIHTLTGPVTDGIQHNIIITHEFDVEMDSVKDYGEWQIEGVINSLKGCLLLKKGYKKLYNEIEAYEAIFRWYPTDDLRIYQHQIYVLHNKTGYKLTASFTKKTRKTLGSQVERMMLSFSPNINKAGKSESR